ncbi:MAG TPA: hypothetical protein IAC02_06915, partial [Candidatus Coprovivens excrementavium]|nr:hypothetical protein [Candidatus Coprovivens excrementavium]
MIYLSNIINTITESDSVFVILVIILVAISAAMFYLIYSQNKEMKELARKNSLNDRDSTKVEKEEELPEEGPELVKLTDEKIPDKLEYTKALWQKDDFDLLSVSHELESLPRERKVSLTPYEEEQEEKAIISYDELVNRKNENISYNNEFRTADNDILVKQVDLDKTQKVDLESSNDIREKDKDYKHEEE